MKDKPDILICTHGERFSTQCLECIKQVCKEVDDKKREGRTSQQNKAMHLYFDLVAKALNDAGLEIEEVIKHSKVDIPWTKDSVKELLWKTCQRSMLGKESTTELSKHDEIDRIWEVMNRFLAKLGIEMVGFPSFEEAMHRLENQDIKIK